MDCIKKPGVESLKSNTVKVPHKGRPITCRTCIYTHESVVLSVRIKETTNIFIHLYTRECAKRKVKYKYT
jgi:LEA14-like dessication related protein